MRFGYVPTPFSIFEGIYAYPGTILSLSSKTQQYSMEQYWDFASVAIFGNRTEKLFSC